MRRVVDLRSNVDLVIKQGVYQILFRLGHFLALILILFGFVLLFGSHGFELVDLLENLRIKFGVKLTVKVRRCDLLESSQCLDILQDSAINLQRFIDPVLGHRHLIAVRPLVGIEVDLEMVLV